MKRKFWFGSLGLMVFLSLALMINWRFGHQLLTPADSLPNNQLTVSQSETDLPIATSVSPMLAQAQPAIKLSQDSDFMVSGGSATATIRFIEGSIKPLDVHVGDTQNFRIVVTSPSGIKRVVAEIETDNGIHEVELTREGLVGILDTYPNPYTVNPQDNTLQVLSQNQLAQARLSEHRRELAQTKTSQANAAAGQREVWIGSWVVNDVHNKTYFTNFIAYDSAGNQEKLTMTWSDLCDIPLSGGWSSASTVSGCVIPNNYIDGVENGNVTLVENKNLTLSSGATFVWNTLNKIDFAGGSLILAASNQSKLKQGELYVLDADNDWHSLPTALGAQTTTHSANYRRRSALISTNDCNDNNNQVVPDSVVFGSTPFVNVVNPTLTYDYNCNGIEEREYSHRCISSSWWNYNLNSQCISPDWASCCVTSGVACCVQSPGFYGCDSGIQTAHAINCGSTITNLAYPATYKNGCDSFGKPNNIFHVTGSTTQRCR